MEKTASSLHRCIRPPSAVCRRLQCVASGSLRRVGIHAAWIQPRNDGVRHRYGAPLRGTAFLAATEKHRTGFRDSLP
ncbi:hypothetical protein Pla52o_19160 [Novipirellula galeiformis]|uniref:Uncharacterized protein n=1 Tax=Novipirellula galeiformis TaxID=2528004 RepID=A0A5C6CGG1_9BACT|nr:hypothetical protein Pla52o_19160 [Novipirellula galeiformis]